MNERIAFNGCSAVGFGASQTTSSAKATLKGAAIGAGTLGLIGAGVGVGISYAGTGKVKGGTVATSAAIGAVVGGIAGAIL